jgi:hypothetical protein
MLKKQENPVYKPLNHPASELAVIIYKAIGEWSKSYYTYYIVVLGGGNLTLSDWWY